MNNLTFSYNVQLQKKIHTHLTEGHQKFLGEGGGGKAKLEFPWGSRGAKQKTFHGGRMDIFWNCTIRL